MIRDLKFYLMSSIHLTLQDKASIDGVDYIPLTPLCTRSNVLRFISGGQSLVMREMNVGMRYILTTGPITSPIIDISINPRPRPGCKHKPAC